MRVYLCRALERSGYEVVAVDRGTAALPLITQERFDLLLTDIVMPEMDGIELAQHVASIAPETRVMFITGFAAVTLRAGAHRAGGQGALQALPPARSRAGGRPHVRQEQRQRAALIFDPLTRMSGTGPLPHPGHPDMVRFGRPGGGSGPVPRCFALPNGNLTP